MIFTYSNTKSLLKLYLLIMSYNEDFYHIMSIVSQYLLSEKNLESINSLTKYNVNSCKKIKIGLYSQPKVENGSCIYYKNHWYILSHKKIIKKFGILFVCKLICEPTKY